MTKPYTKKPLSISEQAQYLIDKDLICQNRERLERYLESIGYYRLSVYWKPFVDVRTNKFKPNTDFEGILKIYVFDRKLRLAILEAIERIEVSLRANWSGTLALAHGSKSYTEENLFNSVFRRDTKTGKPIATFQSESNKIINSVRKSKDPSIIHYRANYVPENQPPIWVIVEIMTFGELSLWFANTKKSHQKHIGKKFGLPSADVAATVFHALNQVRNYCAHHSRLWNRHVTFSLPKIDRLESIFVLHGDDGKKEVDNRIYNYLVLIEYLLKAISPSSQWKNRLVNLLETVESSNYRAMGFPDDWKSREPWCGNNAVTHFENDSMMNPPIE